MYTYRMSVDILRLRDGSPAPWLVTLSIGGNHAFYPGDIFGFPQALCVCDDFGNLVMVSRFR